MYLQVVVVVVFVVIVVIVGATVIDSSATDSLDNSAPALAPVCVCYVQDIIMQADQSTTRPTKSKVAKFSHKIA